LYWDGEFHDDARPIGAVGDVISSADIPEERRNDGEP
jgi:hypothetical protein